MLAVNKSSQFSPNPSRQALDAPVDTPKPPRSDHAGLVAGWSATPAAQTHHLQTEAADTRRITPAIVPADNRQEIDPLYLLACHFEWQQQEEPSAAWELLAAARSTHADTRAHARALLASSHHSGGSASCSSWPSKPKKQLAAEADMNAPYGLEIVENCAECPSVNCEFFCGFSHALRDSLNQVSHKSTLPAGAILFVEGQAPRGVFILCSGTVNLSTTSHVGKTLILKTAEAGEALGLSAAISGAGYEATAETATPCQVSFIERKHFLELIESHPEVGVHTAQSLSRDFQSAYRDIHDLVLTRSSAGKLARLLVSQSPSDDLDEAEVRIPGVMTHEEMAQRIGASRETVTRLLGRLKRKKLIRSDGPRLVIRKRTGLRDIAV